MSRSRYLYSVLFLNAVVWVIWAIGSNHSGLPWPLWVSIASVAVVGSRLGGGRMAPGGGRQRNRNRNRDRG